MVKTISAFSFKRICFFVFSLCLFIFSTALKAAIYESYTEKGPNGFWEVKLGAGLSSAKSGLDGQQVTALNSFGTPITSTISENKPNMPLVYYFSIHKTFVFDKTGIYALSLGSDIYYQQLKSDGYGTNPNLTTYNYSFTGTQALWLVDVKWTPVLLWHHLAPYAVLGMGVNRATNNFIVPFIDPSPPSVTSNQFGLAVEMGLGAEIMFNQSWGLDLRYAYLKSFNQSLQGISTDGPIALAGNSHNFLLSLVYRFGFS